MSPQRPLRRANIIFWTTLVGAVAVLVLALGYWSHRRSASPGPGSDQVLRVGNQLGSAHALMEAAGALKDTPYRIEWSLFPAASPLLEALNARAIDIGGVGDAPFAFAYAGGAPIKAVQVYRYDNAGRAAAILVPAGSPIRTVQDLKGHSIATVRGSAGQDLVLRVLERNGLQPSDVRFVFLNNGDAKAALARGDVDAWSTWSSYVGIALLHDHNRAVADATGLKQGFGFQAATDNAIAGKHALIEDFLHRLNLAYRWAQTHPEAHAAMLAKETGIPLDVARFVGQAVYRPVPITAQMAIDEHETLERYQRAGVIKQTPDLTNAFDPSFNDAAQP